MGTEVILFCMFQLIYEEKIHKFNDFWLNLIKAKDLGLYLDLTFLIFLQRTINFEHFQPPFTITQPPCNNTTSNEVAEDKHETIWRKKCFQK